ncbi:MAG: MFS transporter [Sinimarinibacterium sp.]|jgi:MFS family permease
MTRTTRTAGWLLLALSLLNALNFADRYLIISFSTSIIPELGLTHLQFGLLTGFVFTAVYTVIGLFAGSLADRMDRTYVIGIGLMAWSAMTAATGFARNFGQMAAARMFIGVGEACLTPAAVSMLADAFPPGRRALVSGIYYLGLPVGVGGSFLFAAAAGPALGWRTSFILLGAIGVVAGILVMLFMFDPPRDARTADRSPRKHGQGERLTRERRQELRQWVNASMDANSRDTGDATYLPWIRESFRAMAHELRANPAFALALAGGTAYTFVMGAGILDLVWWVKERGYDVKQAQQLTGLIFLTGGILGSVLGGIGADWSYRRFAGGRLKFLGWVTVAAVPLLLAYRLVPSHTPLFYALAVVGAMLSLMMFGPVFSAVQELAPSEHRSAAVALFLLCAAFVGAGGGNACVGFLSDLFAAQGIDEPITHATLAMSACIVFPIPLFFLAARAQGRRAEPVAIPEPVIA